MTLNKNQASHLRVTEIIVGWIEAILKAIVVKLIADNIYKYGRIVYNWSKPSLAEYKNRSEVAFHRIAVELGFESESTLMIILFGKTNGQTGFIGIFFLILSAISSKVPKRPNPLFRFSNSWLMALAVTKDLKVQNHPIPRPI